MDLMTMAERSRSWLDGPPPRLSTRLRLFCFPHAGGGASVFRAWEARLPRQIDVCPVQLPGREDRLHEPLFTRLGPLVDTLARRLRPSLHGVPFAFFGHSMGALIEFELARELRRQGAPGPERLFVSSARAPHLPDLDPPLHALPDTEFFHELRRLGTPEEVLQDEELRQLVLPALRADLAVCETYAYVTEEPLDCPIVAFGGLQDREVRRSDLKLWRKHSRRSFTLTMIPGDHFLLRPGGQDALLWALSGHLLAAIGP